MTKIGLKLWNVNTDFYLDCAKKLYQEGVFDYIELYVVPNHLNTLKAWEKLDIPFDVHAPHCAHGLNLSKPELFENNKKLYEESKIYADALSCDAFVFHGGSGGSYQETARQLASFNDKRIILENQPLETLAFVHEPYYVGASVKEIAYIMENTEVGFCLDIGHCMCAANAFHINPYSHVEQMNAFKPKRIHLSDIHTDTTMDEHCNFGSGNLDFNRLFSIIDTHHITIETNKKSKTDLNDFKVDVCFLRKKLGY